jgi:predicted nucleic acid-binding protein
MLVVDASCVAEVVLSGPDAEPVRRRLERDPDHAAPSLIDAEVLGVIRRFHLRRELDPTAAQLAIQDLESWSATRFDHRPLLARAWDLRNSMSTADALYVALGEDLAATVLTLDRRLARATGARCAVEVP